MLVFNKYFYKNKKSKLYFEYRVAILNHTSKLERVQHPFEVRVVSFPQAPSFRTSQACFYFWARGFCMARVQVR
jgi:hypothetical protein